MQQYNERFKRFWKEYPERDIEYIRVYPTSVSVMDQDDVWKKKEIVIYIHIPFCKSLCKYCPFTKYPHNDQIIEDYLKALYKEIDMASALPYVQDKRIVSLCIGGGTPTVLSEKQLIGLLEYCKTKFDCVEGLEISIEANPETVDSNKVKSMLDLGVNRISFGIQSFNDRFLQIIGRAHKGEASIRAINMVKELGLGNVGIDLLYRIPGQTIEDWQNELQKAIQLKVDYIATFCLSLVPGTQLFKDIMGGELPQQPSEQVEFEMFDKIKEILVSSNYSQHYIHDYALPGKECEYHKASFYAPQKECLALGAGGRSYINGCFYGNVHPIDDYINTVNSGKLPISFGRKLSKKDEMSRFMVLGVKFLSVSKAKFRECFGINVENVFLETLEKLENWGLIRNDTDFIRVTNKGEKYISNVCKAFYSPEDWGKLQPNGIELQKKEGDFFMQYGTAPKKA
ncbi:MAG TPA: radical SAM family heme chaperone HemW [Pseudobacteroides sp.]|nr:radical SAM family heme chaperone HemW [Pseudobacteroides sp.]